MLQPRIRPCDNSRHLFKASSSTSWNLFTKVILDWSYSYQDNIIIKLHQDDKNILKKKRKKKEKPNQKITKQQQQQQQQQQQTNKQTNNPKTNLNLEIQKYRSILFPLTGVNESGCGDGWGWFTSEFKGNISNDSDFNMRRVIIHLGGLLSEIPLCSQTNRTFARAAMCMFIAHMLVFACEPGTICYTFEATGCLDSTS